MSDLISKRAVINEIERWIGYIDGDMIARINIGINKLPSADRPRPIDPTIEVDLESGVVPISACEPKGPKTIIYADRPRGHWITEEEYGDLYVCDQCGFANEHNDNFCPNCGSDNRGRSEE